MLSHPLLKEAIETEFIPLLIHNNSGGKDAEILKQFGEPSWNFQVVRFLDADAKDIIPRKDRVWTLGGITARMIETLEALDRPTPLYLTTLALPSGEVAEATFSMHCFWTGELELGAVDGVLATEAGWANGKEVTRVWYDTSLTTPTALTKAVTGTLEPNPKDYRPAQQSDQKRQISGTSFAKFSLTPMQAARVNSLARTDPNAAMEWLSPQQQAALKP